MSKLARQNGFTSVLIFFILLLLAGITYFFIITQGKPTKQATQTNVNKNEITISGSIVDNDTSCYHDGVCKVKVDNYWIIIDLGGDPNPEMEKQRGPHGSIISFNGTKTGNIGNDVVGKQVEVFAKILDENTLTLYGSKKYYIRFKN
jgi:hypothetical protein